MVDGWDGSRKFSRPPVPSGVWRESNLDALISTTLRKSVSNPAVDTYWDLPKISLMFVDVVQTGGEFVSEQSLATSHQRSSARDRVVERKFIN